MGANISLPALGLHQQEQPNLLGQYAQIQQIKSGQQQQQLQGLQIQQAQMDAESQKAMMKAYTEANGDINKTLSLAMKYGAKPQDMFKLQQVNLEQQKSNLDLIEKKGARAVQEADFMKGAHDAVDKAPADQKPIVYQQQVQALAKAGVDVSQIPPQYPGDDAFRFIGAGINSHKQQMDELFKKSEEYKNTAQGNDANIKAQQNARVLAGTNAQGLTMEQQMQQRFEQRKQAEVERHNRATEGQFTPEAISMAASQFAATGKLPDVGRNNQARAQIINEAARINPSVDIASNLAAFKANQASLTGLQKNLDSVAAFEQTANKNLDLFLQQAKKVVDTGSPWVNRPLRLIQSGMVGSADQAAYDAARQVAINEIAKVTSSPGLTGVLSDSARKEVSDFNPQSATLKQTYRVAQVLKQDMANRHEAYDQQIQAIKNRIGKGSSQSAAPAQQQAGEISAVAPNGHKIVLKNGKWVDAQTGAPIQ